MPSDVAVEPGVLPVCICGGLGGEPRLAEIGCEQAVGVEGEEVADVHAPGVVEG